MQPQEVQYLNQASKYSPRLAAIVATTTGLGQDSTLLLEAIHRANLDGNCNISSKLVGHHPPLSSRRAIRRLLRVLE